jgi:uncharacterized protein (UPF0147 family)
MCLSEQFLTLCILLPRKLMQEHTHNKNMNHVAHEAKEVLPHREKTRHSLGALD